jgi:hypothetical protein
VRSLPSCRASIAPTLAGTLAPLVAAATGCKSDSRAHRQARQAPTRAKTAPLEKQVRAAEWPRQRRRRVVVSSSRPTIQGNCFDDVKAVLFVVSLIGYNQVMYEDAEQLRLREALTLFEQVVSNPAFVDSTFILALNKKDIFESMIREKPLSRTFPEFAEVEKKGLDGNELLQAALQFIQKQFEDAYYSKSSTPAARRAITTHVIAARFKKDVKYMVEDIHQFIGEHRPGAPRMSAAAATAAARANATHLTSGRAASTREAPPAAAAPPTSRPRRRPSRDRRRRRENSNKSPRVRELSGALSARRARRRAAHRRRRRVPKMPRQRPPGNGESSSSSAATLTTSSSKRRSHKKHSTRTIDAVAAPAVAPPTEK